MIEDPRVTPDILETFQEKCDNIIKIGRQFIEELNKNKPNQLQDLNLVQLLSNLDKIVSALENREKIVISVIGEMKNGKSKFVNCLLNQKFPTLPSFSRPATASLCVLQYAPESSVCLHKQDSEEHEVIPIQKDMQLSKFLIPYVAPENDRENHPYELVEILLPCDILRNGLVIVDTPGLNEAPFLTNRVKEQIKRSQAVVIIVDARKKLTDVEKKELTNIQEELNIQKPFFVCNKFDLVGKAEEGDDDVEIPEEQAKEEAKTRNRTEIIKLFPHLKDSPDESIHFISSQDTWVKLSKNQRPDEDFENLRSKLLSNVLAQRAVSLLFTSKQSLIQNFKRARTNITLAMEKIINKQTQTNQEITQCKNNLIKEQKFIEEEIPKIQKKLDDEARGYLSEVIHKYYEQHLMIALNNAMQSVPFTSFQRSNIETYSQQLVDAASQFMEGFYTEFKLWLDKEFKICFFKKIEEVINQFKNHFKDTILKVEAMISTVCPSISEFKVCGVPLIFTDPLACGAAGAKNMGGQLALLAGILGAVVGVADAGFIGAAILGLACTGAGALFGVIVGGGVALTVATIKTISEYLRSDEDLVKEMKENMFQSNFSETTKNLGQLTNSIVDHIIKIIDLVLNELGRNLLENISYLTDLLEMKQNYKVDLDLGTQNFNQSLIKLQLLQDSLEIL